MNKNPTNERSLPDHSKAGRERTRARLSPNQNQSKQFQRPVRVPLLTHVYSQELLQWAHGHQNWNTEKWMKVAQTDDPNFLFLVMAGCICIP